MFGSNATWLSSSRGAVMRWRSEFAVVGATGACRPFREDDQNQKGLDRSFAGGADCAEATVEFVDRSGPVHQASCRSTGGVKHVCLAIRVKVVRPSAGVLLFQSAALDVGASQSSGGIQRTTCPWCGVVQVPSPQSSYHIMVARANRMAWSEGMAGRCGRNKNRMI